MSYAAAHRQAMRRGEQRRAGRIIVLIPVHDEVGTIAATVQAVLNQSRPPDELFVLVDNRRDRDTANAIAERVAPYGVSVLFTVNNEHRKAGNLNAALSLLLPGLGEDAVVAGFDADSVPDRHFVRNAVRHMECGGYGSVGATFYGRKGGGMLGTLQRAEFARFAQQQHRRPEADVLSGTGWACWASVMRRIARTRPDGTVYDVTSSVEDFELTLALRHAGIAVIAPGDCRVFTDVMEHAKHWASQRDRWQLGTLEELARYGITDKTWHLVYRQIMLYLGMTATPLTALYLAWSFALFGWQGLNPLHAKVYMWCIIAVILEQAWQARKAGPLAVLATLAIFPELLYSLARQVVYTRALWRLLRRKRASWGAGTSI